MKQKIKKVKNPEFYTDKFLRDVSGDEDRIYAYLEDYPLDEAATELGVTVKEIKELDNRISSLKDVMDRDTIISELCYIIIEERDYHKRFVKQLKKELMPSLIADIKNIFDEAVRFKIEIKSQLEK